MENKFKSLDAVLCAFLDQQDLEKSKVVHNDWWWASELGLCPRKNFFRRLGLQQTEKKPYRIKFIGRDGTASHEWRAQAAKTMGVLIASEQSLVDPETRYRGRFDMIVNLDGVIALIDVKTQRPEAFFRRKKAPATKQVEKFQKLQLASYMYFANKSGKWPKITEARIYYVDRGGGLRDEYTFAFKENTFDKVLKELALLNHHWNTELIPDKKSDWSCSYCPYKTICKKVESESLTINNLKTKYGQNNQTQNSN